jgi:hypothetical protein
MDTDFINNLESTIVDALTNYGAVISITTKKTSSESIFEYSSNTDNATVSNLAGKCVETYKLKEAEKKFLGVDAVISIPVKVLRDNGLLDANGNILVTENDKIGCIGKKYNILKIYPDSMVQGYYLFYIFECEEIK